MHPETFEHHTELLNYAERNALTFVWEGTAAFANRARTLPPEEFGICTVRTKQAEFEADRPFREAMAIKRARRAVMREEAKREAIERAKQKR
jgi:hypothetical protein